MHMDIRFPNLNIVLEHVGKNISIGSFTIAYYGMVIGLGFLVGLLIITAIAKRSGQNEDNYVDILLLAMLFGIAGARIYYVVFRWDMYKDNLLSVFNLRQGGLGFYGGLILGTIAVLCYTRVKKLNWRLVLDTVAPAIPFGQAMGRWGNFFNREAFGEYTNNLFAMQLPVDAVRSEDITELMRQNLTAINGVDYIQVHPTFLYESMWNLGVTLLLLILWKKKKFNGEIFLGYLFLYGIGRAWIEGLRTDQLIIPGTGIPVSQLLAAILVVGSAVLWVIAMKGKKPAAEAVETPVGDESSEKEK